MSAKHLSELGESGGLISDLVDDAVLCPPPLAEDHDAWADAEDSHRLAEWSG